MRRRSGSKQRARWARLPAAVALLAALGVVSVGGAQVVVNGNDSPSWSPDGQRLVFVSFRHLRGGEIYTSRADGTQEQRLTNNEVNDDLPKWSPNGERIVFVSQRDGNAEIYAMNADGSGLNRLTNHPRVDSTPVWSPDSLKIAFRSERDGNREIYVMNADGTGLKRLTTNTVPDDSPTWSPTGDRIAFVTDRDRPAENVYVEPHLFVMNADGTNQRKLTPEVGYRTEFRPDWSWRRDQILFVALRDAPVGNANIYVVNGDGSGQRRVTTSPRYDDWPAWSPDGTKIAFSQGPSSFAPEVHLMNADGSSVTRITKTLSARLAQVGSLKVAPNRPAPGKRFSTTLAVIDITGVGSGQVGSGESSGNVALDALGGTITCRATLAGKKLRLVSKRFVRSRAICTWAIPRKGAKGKTVRGLIEITAGRSSVDEKFSFKVK